MATSPDPVRRWVFTALAALLVTAAIAWMLAGGTAAPSAGKARTTEASSAVPQSAAHATATLPERREVATETKPDVAASDIVFAGRCVTAEDGTPIAGVAVTWTPTAYLHSYGGLATLRGEDRKPEAASTHSDRDGRFELSGQLSRCWQQTLSLEIEGRVRIDGLRSGGPPGRTDFGDIAMARGVAASARVVDQDGVPQGRVGLYLTGPQVERKGWLGPTTSLEIRADADGSVPLPPRMVPGPWSVVCRDFEVTGPKHWDVADSGPRFDIVVDSRPETISGVVVDPKGLPIADVAVQPVQRESYLGAVPLSDRDGRFAVRRWTTDRATPHRLDLTRPGCRALQTGPIAWGTHDLRFELAPGRELELLVVDDETGAPVEEYGVRVFWPQGVVPHDWRSTNGAVAYAGRHEGGRVLLSLDDGHNHICVQPAGERHALGTPVDVLAGEAMPRQLIVRLCVRKTRTLRIVTGAGTGLAGSKVQVLRPSAADSDIVDANDGWWSLMPGGRQQEPTMPSVRIAQATSDGQGVATLAVPLRETLELRVSGPLHCPLARPVVFADEPDPMQVVVTVGATVDGRIEPPDFGPRIAALGSERRPAPPSIQLVQELESDFRAFPDKPVVIGPEGTFRIEHVPPGTWTVVALAWIGMAGAGHRQEMLPLGTSGALLEGTTHQLRVDAGQQMPITLNGRVLVNGTPWASQGVQIRFENTAPRLRSRTGPSGYGAGTDGEGVVHVHSWPGRYRVAVNGIEAPEVVTVAPGTTVDATFTVASGSLAVEFVDAGGAAVPNACGIVLDKSDAPRWIDADAAGHVRLQLAPGPVRAGLMPAALREPSARQAWHGKQTDQVRAIREALLGIASGELAPGGELTLRVTVPEGAGY